MPKKPTKSKQEEPVLVSTEEIATDAPLVQECLHRNQGDGKCFDCGQAL